LSGGGKYKLNHYQIHCGNTELACELIYGKFISIAQQHLINWH
jgi:hypothetical protein